jgi:glucose dehydrogenase
MSKTNPITDGDRIYVVTDSLYCFDAETGTTLWTFPASFRLTPALDDSCVYVCGDGLHALDKVNGAEKWSVPMEDANTSLAVLGDRLFQQQNESIVSRDKSDGALMWSFEDPGSELPYFGAGVLAVSDSVICYSIWEGSEGVGKLMALRTLTGEHLWHATFDSVGVYTPIIANDVAYIVEVYAATIWAFDLATGDVLFSDDSAHHFDQPIVSNHTLFVPAWATVTRFRNAVPADGPTVAPISSLVLAASPNPCHNTTSLSFSVSRSGQVNVSVFDLGGRLVLGKIPHMVSAGDHSIELLTADLSAGSYLCRVEAAGLEALARLIVVR